MIDRVAGPRADVEVPIPDVRPVYVEERIGRDSPHDSRDNADDDGVVEVEQEPAVVSLASIGGIGAIHLGRMAQAHSPSWYGNQNVTEQTSGRD